jgi:Thiolase, C-terminal domain
MTLNTIFMFLPLTGLYEPSAIQRLADGRFLVVEDEKEHPFSLVTISPNGSVGSTPLSPGPLVAGGPRVNPNGGAIAIGHPLSASGTRLITIAPNQLQRVMRCAQCLSAWGRALR